MAYATTTLLLISGMRDNSCRERVVRALVSVKGVRDASVNLYRALATIDHQASCTVSDLVRAVESAGCRAAPVSRAELLGVYPAV